MRIETHTQDRRQLANAIGERIHEPVHYNGMPSCAYSVGPVTVERDGTVRCDDTEIWNALTPFFEENSWLEPREHSDTLPADSDLEAQADTFTDTCVNVPMGEATPANLVNLLRTLYARQELINAMTQSDTLFIDEELVTLLSDIKPDTREKICEILRGEIRANMVRGLSFEDGRIRIEFPFCEGDPTRWRIYADLFFAIVRKAFEANRVSATMIDPAETETKYFCNNWLMRMGFGGSGNKEARRVLMGHLKGFAAFRTADGMDAHKAKLTERRRAVRQNAEVSDHEAN